MQTKQEKRKGALARFPKSDKSRKGKRSPTQYLTELARLHALIGGAK